MDKELKAKWIAALRSGEIKQAKGWLLASDGAMCCLGVLERVCGTPDDVIARFSGELTVESKVDGALKREYRGVENKIRRVLAKMNDGVDGQPPQSFAQIADWIEANL